MIRGIIQSVVEGVIKRFSAAGRADETIANREYFQHYGFTSRPLAGAEAILIQEDNHIVMIASDDRRYRLGIEAGEVCLYTDEGDHIRMKRNKEIYVKSGNKLTAEVDNEVAITTKTAVINAVDATVNASASALIKAPAVTIQADAIVMASLSGGGGAAATLRGDFNLEGSITATGNISATGTIIDGAGNTNHHSH
ncbi:MAG: baseplate assembly protein [Syntrophorhabdus sp.]|nr:baseplate assembly protein [Syntrophorhabdus sp.]